MSDTSDRLMALLNTWTEQALDAADAILEEKPDASGSSLVAAIVKSMFQAGVAVGISDLGQQAMVALREVNDDPMAEGLAEVREVLEAASSGSLS